MTLEFKPLGNSCNLGCTYCYQEPMRKAGNVRASKSYDLDLMIKIADEADYTVDHFTLFGGEALLLPKKHLEVLMKASFERFGKVSLQSNGALIDDEHIELFKKYNALVGISIDGPNDLNNMRMSVQKNKSTQDLTSSTMSNLQKLANNQIPTGIIITVHKLNGTKEELPRLLNFIKWLGDIGIKGGNIHMLEVDSKEASDHCLSSEENEYAFLELAKFFDRPENQDLYYQPFREMENMQESSTEANCIWRSCDPMNTQSVYGIEGNGQLSNCGMVNKEGIEWTKAEDNSYMRDIILYQTPDEKGGCKGCEYFLMCNGYCPGSSMDSDWRNKTYYCSSLKKMFKYYEQKVENKGITPLSKRADRVDLETIFFNNLMTNNRPNIREMEKMIKPRVVQVKQ